MKISYRAATFGYCPDLTSPTAVSHPVAVLLIGLCEVGGHKHQVGSVATVRPQIDLSTDPIGSAMMEGLLEFFKSHVMSLAHSMPDSDVDEIFKAIHNSLRNSLHVSSISERRVMEVEGEDLYDCIPALTSKAVFELSTISQPRTDHAEGRQTSTSDDGKPEGESRPVTADHLPFPLTAIRKSELRA